MRLILAIIFVMSTAYATDHRRKIVVIDSGIGWHQEDAPFLCKDGVKSVVNGSVYDNHGHGTNIISIISKKIDPSKWCIVSIKYYEPKMTGNMIDYLMALKLTTLMTNVAIVNLSVEGFHSDMTEERYLKTLLDKNVMIVAAAGNSGLDLNQKCMVWPACYKTKFTSQNFKVVAGKGMIKTNTGTIVTNWRPALKQGFPKLTGTSQATAHLSAEMAK